MRESRQPSAVSRQPAERGQARSSKLEARSWSLVEVCSGSAALTVHLLGGRHALLPYQGSKWKVRRSIEAFLRDQGLVGPPKAVWLNDTGPFGRTWAALTTAADAVADQIHGLGERDPRETYDRLQYSEIPFEQTKFAAEHLFLQRLSVNGKAVTVRREKWNSPGFNRNSAYGCPGTDRFGPVRPMVPHLERVVRSMKETFDNVRTIVTADDVRFLDKDTRKNPFQEFFERDDPIVFLVDPPYEGTTGYGPGHDQFHHGYLGELAGPLLDGGSNAPVLVMVCESKPLDSFVRHGWTPTRMSKATSGHSPFRSTSEEWITWKTVYWEEI